MEGLYLYINIHTPVYYPVNYVEIDRSRDVFMGSKDKSESIIRRRAVQHKCPMNGCLKFGVVVMGAGATAESAVNHHRADVETTSPFSPR